jgi:hypothetical protein
MNCKVKLSSHSSGLVRDRAVSVEDCEPGTIVLCTPPLASALLPQEMERRCSYCHFNPSSSNRRSSPLRRCTGCGVFHYCDSSCQGRHWPRHRRLCKLYKELISSDEWKGLLPDERTDALLLWDTASQIVAREGKISWESDLSAHFTVLDDAIDIFMSLLPGPAQSFTQIPPLLNRTAPRNFLEDIYRRFGNNNFTIHSHLVTYGHGVFPISSRFFNHSCAPNAIPRYTIHPGEPVLQRLGERN